MDFQGIISLIQTVGLPLVILLGVVYYFYLQLNKKDTTIVDKEKVILQLSKEKLDILEKALEKYSQSDKDGVNALNQINTTLSDLKDEIRELRFKITRNER